MNELMTECRNINGLFLFCKCGVLKLCCIFFLAFFSAGCFSYNGILAVCGFLLGVAAVTLAGMLCGDGFVIAAPSVDRFAPIVTESGVLNNLCLGGKSVFVLAKLCGIGHLALFGAGCALGFGGGIYGFAVLMGAIVIADNLCGNCLVIFAPSIGGSFPAMRSLRYGLAFFEDCSAALAADVAGIAFFAAGRCFVVLKLGSAGMVVRVFLYDNSIYKDFTLAVGKLLFADGAFPIFDVALCCAGCRLCIVMNKLMTERRDFYGLFLFCKCGVLKLGCIFFLAFFSAGCRFNGGLYAVYRFGFRFVIMERTAAGRSAGAVVAAPNIGRLAPAMLLLCLNLDCKVGHNAIFEHGLCCVKVRSDTVIGNCAVLARRVLMRHNAKINISAGEYEFSLFIYGNIVFICADKAVLTASAALFCALGDIIDYLVSGGITVTGVINTGNFGHRLIQTSENNACGIADIYLACIFSCKIGYGICKLCRSYDLVCGFSVCGKFKDIVALEKPCCRKASVTVYGNVLPALALIGGKLNGGSISSESGGEIKGCRIFKGVNRIKFGVPFMVGILCRHRKLAFRSADIYYNKCGSFWVGCAVGAGVSGSGISALPSCGGTYFDCIIAYFKDCNACRNALDIHPVAVFAGSGVAGAAVGNRGHSYMLAAGNYFVIKIRLDHNIIGITVDDLPCGTIGAQTESFSDAEGKLVFGVDINKSAALDTLCHLGIFHYIFRALGIFVLAKGNDKFLLLCA